ncbi:MAG: DnaK suppressor protein [Alphaproteobacteria bacterium]
MSKPQPIDIAAVRGELEALRDRVIAATEHGAEAARPVELDQQRTGRLSRMDALQGQEMARAAERRRDIELSKIQAALARLDSGEYGWCAKCGEEIVAERLRLDPAIPICIVCAQGASEA